MLKLSGWPRLTWGISPNMTHNITLRRHYARLGSGEGIHHHEVQKQRTLARSPPLVAPDLNR